MIAKWPNTAHLKYLKLLCNCNIYFRLLHLSVVQILKIDQHLAQLQKSSCMDF